MKLLQISSMVPFPPDDGGRVGIYHITRQFLRHGVDVHFAAPRSRRNDTGGFEGEVPLHLLDVDPRNSFVRAALNLASGVPYTIDKYYSRAASRQLADVVEREKFDAIQVEYLNLARYGIELRERFRLPTVLREHNFQAEIVRRVRDTARSVPLKWYAALQYRRMLRYEADAVREFDMVVPVTDVDDAKLKDLAPGIRTEVIPAGVDVEALRLHAPAARNAALLLTTYEWMPNRDSYDFFIDEIFPILMKRSPGIEVVVAGKHTEKIPAEKRPRGVAVRGFVRDLNDLPGWAPVAVIPLRIGGGMRIKLLELMALGMAVVSTSVGAEGIAARDGEHLLIADSPADFADRIARLISSPAECRRIGANARELVERRYSWNSVGDSFMRLYGNLLGHA